MSNEGIEQLKRDIKNIRTELNELRSIFIADSEMKTNHMVGQDKDIADILRFLMPLLRRAYPQIDATVKQYKAILNNGRSKGPKPGDTDSP